MTFTPKLRKFPESIPEIWCLWEWEAMRSHHFIWVQVNICAKLVEIPSQRFLLIVFTRTGLMHVRTNNPKNIMPSTHNHLLHRGVTTVCIPAPSRCQHLHMNNYCMNVSWGEITSLVFKIAEDESLYSN